MRKIREGFTLVELSLAIAFVGLLSLAVALVINNAVVSYRRGNTFGQMDSVGTDLVDDMRMTVQGTSAKTLMSTCSVLYSDELGEKTECENNDANKFVSVVKKEEVTINGTKIKDVPVYGAFCTGTYSYIWNSGYYWIDGVEFDSKKNSYLNWSWLVLKYKDDAGNDVILANDEQNKNMPFKLIKVRDDERAVCIKAYNTKTGADSILNKYKNVGVFPDANKNGGKMEIDITNIGDGKLGEDPVYLITSGGADSMAIYGLDVQNPAVSVENDSVFYSVSFLLGTIDSDIMVASNGGSGSCEAFSGGAVSDYCAIGRFSFAIRTGGE